MGPNGAGNVVVRPDGTTRANGGNPGATGQPRTNPNSRRQPRDPGQTAGPPANTNNSREHAEQGAKNAAGANDTLLLAALVLGFTVAVSGVVVAAGRRGGRRVH
jgi:hypothetical protein